MNIIETNLNFKGLSYRNSTNRLVLHNADATNCTVEDIHSWHLNNGWSGIGYHFYVRKDGKIYRGRPEMALGSHCKGSNFDSIGICAEGRYNTEIMLEAQKKAIIELCIYLKNKYNINKIYGHKELYSTDCPGRNYPLQEIKASILSGVYIPPTPKSFVKLDGGAYASYKGAPGINLIVRDFSPEIDRIFGWVDTDNGASFAFAKEVPNGNYVKLEKNCNKVITTRNDGYSFSKGSTYKITAKGYNKDGKVVVENKITIKIPCN